jgi:hypothetical protein
VERAVLAARVMKAAAALQTPTPPLSRLPHLRSEAAAAAAAAEAAAEKLMESLVAR